MKQRRPERVQQEMVRVILDDRGLHFHEGGHTDVQMNVFKPAGADVLVGEMRRNNHNIALTVIQGTVIKGKCTHSLCTVNEFPAFMGMALDGHHHFMASRVSNFIHAQHSLASSVCCRGSSKATNLL